jgi:hypothetical protein
MHFSWLQISPSWQSTLCMVKMVEMWETADQNHPSQLDSVSHFLQRSLHYLLGMTARDETCQMRVTQVDRQQADQVKSRILNQLHPPAVSLMSTTDPEKGMVAVEVEHIGSWSSQEFRELKNMISADDLGCRTVESRSIVGMRKDHAETNSKRSACRVNVSVRERDFGHVLFYSQRSYSLSQSAPVSQPIMRSCRRHSKQERLSEENRHLLFRRHPVHEVRSHHSLPRTCRATFCPK